MCTFSLHTRTRTDYQAAAAQSQLRKATAYATSLAAAGAVADEKARKLREAADRLAGPKSD